MVAEDSDPEEHEKGFDPEGGTFRVEAEEKTAQSDEGGAYPESGSSLRFVVERHDDLLVVTRLQIVADQFPQGGSDGLSRIVQGGWY